MAPSRFIEDIEEGHTPFIRGSIHRGSIENIEKGHTPLIEEGHTPLIQSGKDKHNRPDVVSGGHRGASIIPRWLTAALIPVHRQCNSTRDAVSRVRLVDPWMSAPDSPSPIGAGRRPRPACRASVGTQAANASETAPAGLLRQDLARADHRADEAVDQPLEHRHRRAPG